MQRAQIVAQVQDFIELTQTQHASIHILLRVELVHVQGLTCV